MTTTAPDDATDTLDFEDATVPTLTREGVTGRKPMPNPFQDKVNALIPGDKNSAFSYFREGPASTDTETGNPILRRDRRQLDAASNLRKNAAGELEQVSIRWTFQPAERNGVKGARVTVWAIEKMYKPGAGRKPKKTTKNTANTK